MAAGTPVRILLARHGETVFNVEGRWQGQSASRLTERGLAQARELARALADEPIAAVYSSDLGRAVDTAAEVAKLHHLAVTTDERLREIDTGAWTGKGRAEITAEFPGGLEAWATQPTSMRLPNGETLFEAQTRALAFFAQRMPAHAAQTVVVISHGAIGQTILVNAMGGTVEGGDSPAGGGSAARGPVGRREDRRGGGGARGGGLAELAEPARGGGAVPPGPPDKRFPAPPRPPASPAMAPDGAEIAPDRH